MGFQRVGEIGYYTFDCLEQLGILHGIFSRHGGVSPAPWASLNVGGMVGDEPTNVIENRERIFSTLGRKVESLYDCWLIHSNEAIRVASPRPLNTPHKKADIIITDRPEITLFMRYADCVPIILFDPVNKVICLAHAGWVGTLNRIARTAVEKMNEWYQCKPGNIVGCIGPSICAEHYPVGNEVVEKARNVFGKTVERVVINMDSRFHMDLWEANRIVLNEAGVDQIQISGICTACHNEDWFSHRAEKGKTGRFGALITLGEPND